MKPHTCPVCSGEGQIAGSLATRLCPACKGACIVWEPSTPPPYTGGIVPRPFMPGGPVPCVPTIGQGSGSLSDPDPKRPLRVRVGPVRMSADGAALFPLTRMIDRG